MDGLSRASGVGPTITLGGRSLTVNAHILRHYAEMEAEIIKRRGNPFDMIRLAKEALADSPELMDRFVAAAFDEAKKWRTVSLGEIQEFLSDTWAGTCFALWLVVRDNDPQTLTLENVTRMFSDEYEERLRKYGNDAALEWRIEIENAIDQANGGDELGNSTGSEPPTEPAPETPSPGS